MRLNTKRMKYLITPCQPKTSTKRMKFLTTPCQSKNNIRRRKLVEVKLQLFRSRSHTITNNLKKLRKFQENLPAGIIFSHDKVYK